MVSTTDLKQARGMILVTGRGTISMAVTKHVLYAAAILAFHPAPAFDELSLPKELTDD